MQLHRCARSIAQPATPAPQNAVVRRQIERLPSQWLMVANCRHPRCSSANSFFLQVPGRAPFFDRAAEAATRVSLQLGRTLMPRKLAGFFAVTLVLVATAFTGETRSGYKVLQPIDRKSTRLNSSHGYT